MKPYFLHIAFVLLSLQACGTDNANKTTSHDKGFANSQVGLIEIGDRFCNGFFTSPETFQTAYHCLETRPGEITPVETLKIRTSERESIDVSKIDSLIPAKDLAVLKVEAQDELTNLEQGSIDMEKSISLLALDPDSGNLVKNDCHGDKKIDVAGAFTHDCKTKGHFSGAPLVQSGRVVGMHLGYKKKVDRRVALDLGRLAATDTDILELEFQKEGCHTRAHVRGGVFNGHTRAHSRGCAPDIGGVIGALTGIKKSADRELSKQREVASLLDREFETHSRLLNQINQAWNEFLACYDRAKAARDKEAGQNCFAEMRKKFDRMIAELKVELEKQAEFLSHRLQSKAQRNQRTRALSQVVVNTYNTYKSCTAGLDTSNRGQYQAGFARCTRAFKSSMDMISSQIDLLGRLPGTRPFPFGL